MVRGRVNIPLSFAAIHSVSVSSMKTLNPDSEEIQILSPRLPIVSERPVNAD